VAVAPLVRPCEGLTVLLTFRVGPLVVLAPCRVVSVIDEADAYGFTYGTLPGHPERGEESFTIRRDASGTVRFEIVAVSQPADLLARLGRPVARLVQRRVGRKYLTALADSR
jgi:uncharacterized protein (UPF0548 family)